jgi:hypothetical protein
MGSLEMVEQAPTRVATEQADAPAAPAPRRSFLKSLGVGAVAAQAGYLAGKVDTARAADPELAAHVAATTNVHGIPDTSVLAKYTTAGTFTAAQRFVSPDSETVPVTVKGAASPQNANLSEWRNGAGTVLSRIDGEGSLYVPHMELTQPSSSNATPELFLEAANGKWLMGIDSASAVPGRDLVLAAKFNPGGQGVNDLIYCAHNGTKAPTVGIGMVPPSLNYRLQISPEDSEPDMGGLAIRVATSSTGHPFALIDSASGQPRYWIDHNYFHSPIKVRADATTNRALTIARSDGGGHYAFEYISDGSLSFRYVTGGVESYRIGGNGRLRTVKPPDFTGSGAQFPHVGGSSPSGGLTGELRVGTNKLWVNDNGSWKSIPVS